MKWYYIDESVTEGDRRKGPYNIDEIESFVNSGEIKPETLVWHTGMTSWEAWSKVQSDTQSKQSEEEKLIKAALETIIENHVGSIKKRAGFWIRAVAIIIDNFILSVIGVTLFLIFAQFNLVNLEALTEAANAYLSNPASIEAMNELVGIPDMQVLITLGSIIQAIYFIVFTALYAATPGKKLLKIHVENKDGSKIGFLVSIIRYIASIFTQATLMFYGIGYLLALIDPKRRALHDWVARTYVAYDEKPKTK